uniref:Uncharacterized protein n=1 Tax=Hyaloperonospora arabidopsidis (strain Emoy2) TaxID=559515 RepID=M4BN90_HYAAE
MKPSTVRVVGADAVGKTSFVLALGVKEQTPRRYIWPRNGRRDKTMVHIVRSREEVSSNWDDTDHDEKEDIEEVFVLLFDLTRRDSLAAVLAQWNHLLNITGRKPLLLVGTHADCTSTRSVTPAEVREISGDFHAYEEVCCRPGQSGDKGMLRVQLMLTQWISGGPAKMASGLPFARASICGGFPRPVVTMMMPAGAARSLPRSPTGLQHSRRHAADVQLSTEDGSSRLEAVVGPGAGDVKLRTISKAIYDIRSAVAEKSKVLAKYRDRQVTHWLTRSRYFGPTESSRHKRWHEEQKKRQLLTQCHVHYHDGGHMLRQSNNLDACVQDARGRSVSYPNKCEVPGQKSSTQRDPAHFSSPSSSEGEESPATCSEPKGFAQLTELTKQRQLEAEAAQEQKKRLAAKRALRKQRRATSDDIYERSTVPPAIFDSYLNCYDEMDVPSQPQSSLLSLDQRKSMTRPSLASTTSRKSFTSRDRTSLEMGSTTLAGMQHSTERLSLEAEPVNSMPTPAQFLSPLPCIMDPLAPSLVQSHHSAPSSLEHRIVHHPVPNSTTSDKARAVFVMSPSCPAPPPVGTVSPMSTGQRAIKCSNSLQTVDCSNIDKISKHFKDLTLPI